MEFQLKDDETALPQPLTLRSNVAFMFIVLVIGLTFSISLFLTERLCYMLKWESIAKQVVDFMVRCSSNRPSTTTQSVQSVDNSLAHTSSIPLAATLHPQSPGSNSMPIVDIS